MAQRGIREYTAKRLIAENIGTYSDHRIELPSKQILIREGENIGDYAKKPGYEWLKESKLAIKPDQLFGKRGKSNLLLLDATLDEADMFIQEMMGRKVVVGDTEGILKDFLVEPYVLHDVEYYLAIRTERERDVIHFSTEGGVEIEENWDRVLSIEVPVIGGLDEVNVLEKLPEFKDREIVAAFIEPLYKLFCDLGFAFLEINPFTVKDGAVIPIDAVAKLDDTAAFEVGSKWDSVEFPAPFGRILSKEEELITSLDDKSGASLKLTILNPEGRIWTMVAGGGASVIYADTVSDLGFGSELANYGEYSGNPTTDETYVYAKTILDLMTRKKDPQGRKKYLLIGGGIANFTDVAKTFTGIVQALTEYKERLQDTNVEIYVRRGGPNYKEGLKIMKELGKSLGVPIEVFGPETHMTKIVKLALEA
ncbi:MAG: ATP citrate lyase citrate-binding domain-containing protein [Candidatus Syntropharchaeales archaeon]